MEDKNYKLKKLIKELESMRGRHTELITVYVPAGHNLNEIVGLLSQEVSLTQNVKSKAVRKNVITALTKVLQHLKLYKQTPEHGLAIFCGNVSENEGIADMKIWAIEPPEPLKVKLYWCDQKFELAPLKDMVKEKDVYVLAVLDLQEATIGVLKGKTVQTVRYLESLVPGKTSKGGQSAQRFGRVREGLIGDFFKKVAEAIRAAVPEGSRGIIIGGPGPAKSDLIDRGYLMTDIKNMVLGVRDTGYADEHGLQELLERSRDLLAEAAVAKEKDLVQRLMEGLQRDTGLVTYGVVAVKNALLLGAVSMILISEEVDWEEVEYACSCGNSEKRFIRKGSDVKCAKCGKVIKVLGRMDAVDAFEELAKQFGTEVVVVSRSSREGEQLYALGGVAAFLRYKL